MKLSTLWQEFVQIYWTLQMEWFHSMQLYKAVLPPIPVIVDISWMEIQLEFASLMGHGVAVLLPAYVRTQIKLML